MQALRSSLSPPPSQPTASNLRSLHLLRALLREASYLPDANARQYFRRYIVNRFRAYQPADKASPSIAARAVERYRHGSPGRRAVSIISARTRAMQRKAQKGLNLLRRANHSKIMQKILFFAYGRMGKRKYALLDGLLRPEDPAAAQELSPLQKLYYSNERCLSFFDAPQEATPTHYKIPISDRYSRLKAVIKAQAHNGIALQREIKLPYIYTPINNVWERPMPIRRARGNVRRWYADTMTKLLPPLPSDEFDAIQQMANGTKQISFVKPRSPAIASRPQETQGAEQFTELVQDALALQKPAKADKMDTDRPRRLTARFMRRNYAKLSMFCSKLEWNEKFNKWETVWGTGFRRSNPRGHPESVSDKLFAGVDTKGQVLTESQSDTGNSSGEGKTDAVEVIDSGPTTHQKDKTRKEKRTPRAIFVD